MKLPYNKKLILSLLLDDLIHTKLIESLQAIGFEQNWYSINVSETFINLMGFCGQLEELVYEYYLDRRRSAMIIDLSDGNDEMKKLALTIYNELLHLKS